MQVVPQAVLKDQQVVALDQAIQNVSGVIPNNDSYGTGDSFSIRGFDAMEMTYEDGLRLDQYSTSGFPVDMANTERVEVIKGPASVLYGQAEPGGVVNIVTKKPLDAAHYSLEQQAGSYDFYQTTLDATGPLFSKKFDYRFVLDYINSGSFRDFVFTDRFSVYPSIEWKPNDKTQLIGTFNYNTGRQDPKPHPPLDRRGSDFGRSMPRVGPDRSRTGHTAATASTSPRAAIWIRCSPNSTERTPAAPGRRLHASRGARSRFDGLLRRRQRDSGRGRRRLGLSYAGPRRVVAVFRRWGRRLGDLLRGANFAAPKNCRSCSSLRTTAMPSIPSLRPPQANRPKEGRPGLGLLGKSFDGNDAGKVYAAARQAAQAARKGGGPRLLEFKTFRWGEHVGPGNDLTEAYRHAGEKIRALKRDPLKIAEAGLRLSPARLDALRSEARRDVDQAVAFAEKSPFPGPERLMADVFA